jgi:hypothetical protein
VDEAAAGAPRTAAWRGFEVALAVKLFDRNLPVRFHKVMVAADLKKSPVLGVHAAAPNESLGAGKAL